MTPTHLFPAPVPPHPWLCATHAVCPKAPFLGQTLDEHSLRCTEESLAEDSSYLNATACMASCAGSDRAVAAACVNGAWVDLDGTCNDPPGGQTWIVLGHKGLCAVLKGVCAGCCIGCWPLYWVTRGSVLTRGHKGLCAFRVWQGRTSFGGCTAAALLCCFL
jgi:hypothetical protein